MNWFFLHSDPKAAARMFFDVHVNKILLEVVQLLMSAHWVAVHGSVDAARAACREYKYGDSSAIMDCSSWGQAVKERCVYKGTHWNHPLAVWARERRANYEYLAAGAKALAEEYLARAGRTHKCTGCAAWLSSTVPARFALDIVYKAGTKRFEDLVPLGCSPAPACCPEAFHGKNLVASYLKYYVKDKAVLKHKVRLGKKKKSISLGKRKRAATGLTQ